VIAARRAVYGVPFSERGGGVSLHDKEQLMNVFGEPWTTRHARYFSDPDAGPEALLNDATEWLHYAHNNLQLLTELINERGAPDVRRLTVMLEGIAAFIEMGTRSATQAHLRMQWRQVRREAGRSTSAA
jgi:hypothetical protein